MTAFFRFPHTSHLAWLATGHPRGDKVLAPDEVEVLLAGDVVVEEKVDGANIGFSTNEDGEVRVQNRGQYLDPAHSHGQFKPLWSWLPSREQTLADELYPSLILFGEWCYAVHSVQYDRLPDWFLGFDIYDRSVNGFWDKGRRDALLAAVGLVGIPCLAEGVFSLEQLAELLSTPSRVGEDSMEGIIVRKEAGGLTTARAKLVRPEFAQAIEEHWSRGELRRNELKQGAAPWR